MLHSAMGSAYVALSHSALATSHSQSRTSASAPTSRRTPTAILVGRPPTAQIDQLGDTDVLRQCIDFNIAYGSPRARASRNVAGAIRSDALRPSPRLCG